MPKTTITVDGGEAPNVSASTPANQTTPPQAPIQAQVQNKPQAPVEEIDYKKEYLKLKKQTEIQNQLQDIAPEHHDIFELVMKNASNPAKIKAELLAKNSAYKKSEVPAPANTPQPQAFTQPDVNAGGIGTQNTNIDPLDSFVPKEVRQASKWFKKNMN